MQNTKERHMPRVILINPANRSYGCSFITPRWLFVLAAATPTDLVGDPIVVDESIRKFNPRSANPGDIIGIGITTDNCLAGYRVLRAAKERGATVIMGGVHTTIFPDEPLRMGADSVITGNGDIAWGQAIKDCLDGKLRKCYAGGRVEGDDMVPARWDLLDRDKYLFPTISTVAGCVHNCTFCSVWPIDGRTLRMRMADGVIREVNTLLDMGFPFVIFGDDIFNPGTLGHIEREESPSARKKLEKIREQRFAFFDEYAARVKRIVPAFTQMTSEIATDDEYLRRMHDQMGIRCALVGVESFSEDALRKIRKAWNPVGKKMVEAIQKIQTHGIYVLASIICGIETDTPETLATMRGFAKESGALLVQFTLYQPYPGTVDFEEMRRDRERRLSPGPFPYIPKHRVQLLHDNFWLNPERPRFLIKHPTMSDDAILRGAEDGWKSFYALRESWKRAFRLRWPLFGKLMLAFGSLAFKDLYSGRGISADSATTERSSVFPRMLLWCVKRIQNLAFARPSSAPTPPLQ